MHLTCRTEFFDWTELAADLPTLRKQFRQWVGRFNWVRPHDGLGMKKPMGYIGPCRQAGIWIPYVMN